MFERPLCAGFALVRIARVNTLEYAEPLPVRKESNKLIIVVNSTHCDSFIPPKYSAVQLRLHPKWASQDVNPHQTDPTSQVCYYSGLAPALLAPPIICGPAPLLYQLRIIVVIDVSYYSLRPFECLILVLTMENGKSLPSTF